ncbi:MAG: filamentation induced by cAMP protein fic [Rhodocyclaceae bacterium]|nr:MAG: filamentation induced by cAMP protein fic [Rhodocyclaceae bacterium]TND03549.1 MAG: filamentation induced by cAMP protein fic [Rhodocyclaceae bacterium]
MFDSSGAIGIHDTLRDLENLMHAEDGPGDMDVLVKLAPMHCQFEAIHPFPHGTGRILNSLFLVERDLLNLPVLYLSRCIIDHKPAYFDGLRRVTEEGAWSDWVLYLLDAVGRTSLMSASSSIRH